MRFIMITLLSILCGLEFLYAEVLPDKVVLEAENIVPQALDASLQEIEILGQEEKINLSLENDLQSVVVQTTKLEAAKEKPAEKIKNELKESEIPVLTNVKAKKMESTHPALRLFFSFLIVGALAFGLILFSRWYAKKGLKPTDNSKIRILNQHFLGPKRSLAIVRVAGESILIGITEQNISMLKTLSLLDEEIPELASENFNSAMNRADDKQQAKTPAIDEAEDFIIGSIKDKVSSKIKSMRTI